MEHNIRQKRNFMNVSFELLIDNGEAGTYDFAFIGKSKYNNIALKGECRYFDQGVQRWH